MQGLYKIDSNVPMPAPRAKERKYPLDSLDVGQSFFVPGVEMASVSGSISKGARQMKIKCQCRAVVEGGVSGVRVWRVE